MKKIIILFLFLVVCPYQSNADSDCGADTPCSDESPAPTEIKVSEISYDDMVRLHASDESYILLDVRSQQSYDSQHIKGAVNLYVGQSTDEQIFSFLPEKRAKIVVYCSSSSCPLSEYSAQRLIKLGYTNILHYKGGIAEWSSLKQPFESTIPKNIPLP
ncbi:MAG: rhodanese-like domain-containing protein [Candidatus Omnitrophica bacterium]|nr:rhodanese-like domain-containing protein [Candidatus Omnitrophota bacterium]